MVTITIRNEDCIVGISQLEDYSIDLVVTSPPYNVDLGNNKYHKSPYDLYNDNKEHKEYIEWLKLIFKELYPKMAIGGRVCINIGDGENGAVPTSSDIIQFMKELKYIPLTHIIWNKSHVGNRTAWGSFLSASCPSFPTSFEHILIFYKEQKKLQRVIGESDLTKDEFIEWAFSLWSFPPEMRMQEIGHNAMFPEELLKRCIKMLSYVGSTVCDIFSGAGTTAVVCKKLNRNFVGFEISKNYCRIANERLENVEVEINKSKNLEEEKKSQKGIFEY